jgi:hypothetical protein
MAGMVPLDPQSKLITKWNVYHVDDYRMNVGDVHISWLVVLSILKNMKVNGKDDIPYIMENNPNVPNHQPVSLLPCCLLAMPIDVSAKKY